MSQERINDFVVKFANVNGSGSASANQLFAKSILRMGVAVSPRNIFPSNIQGLPTWYEVRVSEAGYLGARLSATDSADAGTGRPSAFPDQRLNKCNQLAELTGPVVHEFNNFLNTIVLQAAVLESQVAKKHLPDLSIIRNQAQAITGIIKRFQQRRDRERSAVEPRDLNLAVTEVVQSFAPAAVRTLRLTVLYDDGYIAYLNGVEVDRANVPGSPGQTQPRTAVANYFNSLSARTASPGRTPANRCGCAPTCPRRAAPTPR